MTKLFKVGCLLNLIFFSVFAVGDDFSDADLIGKSFWVKPAKEIYRRLEFYREPRIEGATFFPSSKKQIRVISVARGWIKFSFVGAGYDEAWVPLGYFRRNFYNYSTFNNYAFDRATFFNEDPDLISARASSATLTPIGKNKKTKSTASKFFRHSHKCCGPNRIGQPKYGTSPKN